MTASTKTDEQMETKPCLRCAGTGLYPSSRWNGTCLMCRGRKVVKARRAPNVSASEPIATPEPTESERQESADWMLAWMNQ